MQLKPWTPRRITNRCASGLIDDLMKGIRSSILWLATRSPAWPLLAPRIHHPLPNQLHLDRIQASESILVVQDGLLYLAAVLEESNDIVASRANPAIPESLKLLLAVEPSSLLRETRNFLIMRGLR